MLTREFNENSIAGAIVHAVFGVKKSLIVSLVKGECTPPARAGRPRAGEWARLDPAFGLKPAA